MHTHKGVVSGGSQPVVDAGAAVLRAGGNAIDALVAASLAITAGEPTVTSLAGGGVLTYRAADTGDVTVLDFFSDAPALRQSDVENLDFYHLDLSYGRPLSVSISARLPQFPE